MYPDVMVDKFMSIHLTTVQCISIHQHSTVLTLLENYCKKSITVWKILTKFCKFHAASRDMAMRRSFWGFCINWIPIDPLHYLSSRSDFGFEFEEIIVIEK
jgi:hypothetical protein